MALTRRQHAAIRALLTEPTVADAAKACGVSVRTLYTWRASEAFAEEFRRAQRAVMDQVVAHAQQLACSALDTLKTITEDDKAAAPARVSAAKALLSAAFRSYELDDLAARLRALEGKVSP